MKNSLSTVKHLNSILSEIFCGVQMTHRSFLPSGTQDYSNKSHSFWSAEESEILPQPPIKKSLCKKDFFIKGQLVKKSVNKGILLKKFKPVNFLNGFKNKKEENHKVIRYFTH